MTKEDKLLWAEFMVSTDISGYIFFNLEDMLEHVFTEKSDIVSAL